MHTYIRLEMFGLLQRKRSLLESGLLKGATDSHSHILFGLDDGVKTAEDSLKIMEFYEQAGLDTLWLTPHTMEDVPNTTEGIRARFEEFKALYHGPIKLELASEYMIDTLFEKRLEDRDLLMHGEDTVLVETSTQFPPINLWDVLDTMLKAGYRPLVAHPERYHYMQKEDYRRLHDMGCLMQLNLPSLVGVYGETVALKAHELLKKGWYCMAGSDCHRYHALMKQYGAQVLKKDELALLETIIHG